MFPTRGLQRHMTSKWCCFDVYAMSSRSINVSTTSFSRHVPAGSFLIVQKLFFNRILPKFWRFHKLLLSHIDVKGYIFQNLRKENLFPAMTKHPDTHQCCNLVCRTLIFTTITSDPKSFKLICVHCDINLMVFKYDKTFQITLIHILICRN